MDITTKIINLLTILLGLGVAVMAYLFLQASDQLRENIFTKQAELDKATLELASTEKKAEKDGRSLNARNASLRDDFKQHEAEVEDLKEALPEKERKLEELKAQQDKARRERDEKIAEVSRLETEVAGIKEQVDRLRLANPTTRAASDQLRADIREQNDLTEQLDLELRDYKVETEHLRVHYASILEAMEIDAKSPSWIVLGKIVTTKIQRLSMETGMLVFPLGSYHGMRNEMRFNVARKGRLLCQVRIKEAHLGHSVANIVPLIGNPTKLRELDTVEITGF